MIHNEQELTIVREQLHVAEQALKAIRDEVRPVSESRFLMMAESYVDVIQELRAQVDEYLGLQAVADAEEAASVEGVIREVDLDENTFILREVTESEAELHCEYAEADEEDVKSLLGERVVVTGTIRKSAKTGRQTMEADFIQAVRLEDDVQETAL
jgi:hypothetical protein